ncbi:MAG TPA: hypothetical protein VLG76_06765 [Rhabdochlamydiaceae bacterium]|nr:hypothetical protein [Rhabdochlamydiaceae bacterium]
MYTQKLSFCPVLDFWKFPLVHSNSEILQALKDCASTKEIERLRKKVKALDATSLAVALKYKNSKETIRFLLDTGIKPTAADLKTALEYKNTKEVLELLIKQMNGSHLESAISDAIRTKNSFEIIKLLIDAGAPCESVCVMMAEGLNASRAIIDLVTQANCQWREKLLAHCEKRAEEQRQIVHKKRKLIEMTDSLDEPKYDYQLIFDMRPKTDQAEALAEKAIKKGIPTNILYLERDPTKEQMERVTHRSRVYIIAHGFEGTDHLSGGSRMKKITITFERFANLFLLAPKLKEEPTIKQRVKISLVVCEGATPGKKGEKSFAEKLSGSLYSKDIKAVVVARKGGSSTDVDKMRKLIDEAHHKEGTKFSFITTDKDTIITPIRYGPS